MKFISRPAAVCFSAAILLALPAQSAGVSFTRSFAGTSNSTTAGSTCSEFDLSRGQTRTCVQRDLFYDADTATFYQLDSEAQAQGAFGNLKTRSSLDYKKVDFFTQDEDGVIGVYTSDPNVEPAEGEPPAQRLGDLASFSPVPSFIEASSNASVQDAWLITGGDAGTTGTLALDFQFDGESSSPSVQNGVNVEADLFAQSSTTLQIRRRDGVNGPVEQIGGSILSGFNGAVDQLASLELDFTFGEGFAIDIFMNSLSSLFADTTATDPVLREALTFTDFFNTATLADFRVFDENEQEIAFNLVSDSNDEAFQQFSTTLTTIPLPAGAPLLIGALGVLGLLRLRQRKSA